MSVLLLAEATRPCVCEQIDGQLRAYATGPCPTDCAPWRGAGANLFDLFWCASSGQAMGTSCSFADSSEQLATAKAAGIRYARFFAADWGPNKAWWVTHETQYWAEFDRLWAQMDASGLSVIPSLGTDDWDKVANAVTPGLNETANDYVRNTTSIGRQLAVRYVSTFVQRYANRSSILLWELGNELNLQVNLPPPWCGDDQCFGTDEMVAFTKVLADAIRSADRAGHRPISSGFSAPRPSAWHQEHCPLHGACAADPTSKGYWAVDTRSQWLGMLRAQHAAVGVWSMHLYDSATCFFEDCVKGAAVVEAAAREATDAHALLFVGEYGGPAPHYTGPSADDQAFPQALLDLQVADAQADGAFGLSALWAWECPTHRTDMVCVWPGSTVKNESGSDAMVSMLQQANAQLGHRMAGDSEPE